MHERIWQPNACETHSPQIKYKNSMTQAHFSRQFYVSCALCIVHGAGAPCRRNLFNCLHRMGRRRQRRAFVCRNRFLFASFRVYKRKSRMQCIRHLNFNMFSRIERGKESKRWAGSERGAENVNAKEAKATNKNVISELIEKPKEGVLFIHTQHTHCTLELDTASKCTQRRTQYQIKRKPHTLYLHTGYI